MKGDKDLARSATAGSIEDLIARLEKAAGPDEALDVAIVYALHPNIGRYDGLCVGDPPIFWHEPYRKQPCPKFTASIDAALTLVPPAHEWRVGSDAENNRGFAYVSDDVWDESMKDCMGSAATTAIALCIAALKARATSRPKEQDHG